MATLVMPCVLNQAATSCRSWGKVPKAFTGLSVTSGFTAAICSREPMSTAAAMTFTVSISVDFGSFALPSFILLLAAEGRGLCKSVIFLIGITAPVTSPFSSSHQPMDHVF